MTDDSAPTMLLVAADLMLGSMVHGHASAAGYSIDRCLSSVKAFEKLATTSYPVVVVELGLKDLDLAALKAAANDAAVIGFVGHVRTDLINSADSAGLTVLTNGQMHSQGETIFRNLRQAAGPIAEL